MNLCLKRLMFILTVCWAVSSAASERSTTVELNESSKLRYFNVAVPSMLPGGNEFSQDFLFSTPGHMCPLMSLEWFQASAGVIMSRPLPLSRIMVAPLSRITQEDVEYLHLINIITQD